MFDSQTRYDKLLAVSVIGLFLLAVLASVGTFIALVAVGRIPVDFVISGRLRFNGSIPLDVLLFGILGGVYILIRVSLSEVFGQQQVAQAEESLDEMRNGGGDGTDGDGDTDTDTDDTTHD